MSCCVPNCGTCYWRKSAAGITMFKASTEKQLAEWGEVLKREVGLASMKQKDRVCILHFNEDVIEREHTIYLKLGKHRKITRKIPLLSPNAIPSIFPEKSYEPPKKSRKRAKYYDLASPEVLAEQRKIYQEIQRDTYSTDCLKKVKKKVRSRKRNCESTCEVKKEIEEKEIGEKEIEEKEAVKLEVEEIDDGATADVESEEEEEIDDLFDYLAKAVRQRRIVSEYLPNDWISNFHDSGCISWSLWKDDCSGHAKRIILYRDLIAECYLNGKSICLPGLSKIESIHDFEKLTKTFSNVNICYGVDGDLGEEDCLNFVILKKQGGRPQLRCAPCSRLVRNVRRRKGCFEE